MSQSSSSFSTPPNGPERERLLELFTEQALHDLSEQQAAELRSLRDVDRTLDPLDFEIAAAAAHQALIEHSAQSMPADVRAQLESTAAAWGRGSRRAAKQLRSVKVSEPIMDVVQRRQSRLSVAASIGWLAAAACLALAIVGWWPRIAPAPSYAKQRQEMMVHVPDRIVIPWNPGPDPTGHNASGDVVWSPSLKKGFIRVRGMAVNDPKREQYQLWVGDENQPKPIDCGVFNVADSTSDLILPIHAKLPVTGATLFAVTVERPGGMVEPDLKRLSVAVDPSKATSR
jgi:Anti-sigma-K factor rskA